MEPGGRTVYVKAEPPKVREWNRCAGDGQIILVCKFKRRASDKKSKLVRSCAHGLGPWTTHAQAMLHADAFRDLLEYGGAAGGGRKRAAPDTGKVRQCLVYIYACYSYRTISHPYFTNPSRRARGSLSDQQTHAQHDRSTLPKEKVS